MAQVNPNPRARAAGTGRGRPTTNAVDQTVSKGEPWPDSKVCCCIPQLAASTSLTDLRLWHTTGNAREGCQDSYDPQAYLRRVGDKPAGNPLVDNGCGALALRGRSYLCYDSYCNRDRNSARSANTPDSSVGNAGWRTLTGFSDSA